MKKPTTLSITLLTCNRLGVTKKTLNYLLATTHVDYELVIVHNHNHTKQAQKVADFFKNTKIKSTPNLKKIVKVFNPQNRGVAGGRNDGMFRSTGKHRVVIDDDILAPDGWAEEMLAIIEKLPGVGTVGCSVEPQDYKIVEKNGVRFQAKGDNIGGAFIMIPHRTFKRVGYFCEDYGVYGLEDADYHLRLKFLNLRNVYITMKGQHIDPETDKEYRKFKNSVYERKGKLIRRLESNGSKYSKGKGIYQPYVPRIAE